MLGADTFIRVGTCGGMQQQVLPGDVIIANSAIRAEGTSREYLPIEFPAVADYTVLTALAAVFWVLLLLPNVRTETHSWAYIAPMVLGLLAVAYELMALWRLLTAGQRVTREHSDKISGRIQFVSVAHTVLALCALAGAVVMLCTNPFSNRNLLLRCGAFLWAVCGAVMAFTLAMYIPVFVKMNREAKADAGEK